MANKVGELALIERIRGPWGWGRDGLGAARGALALGIGDDCAIMRPPRGHEVLVTTDFTLEGRHFRREWHPPQSVGHRTLARGLSDLAAMGARPIGAFLSLALPGEMVRTAAGRTWVAGFFAGMRNLGERMGVPLAGGDTAESPCGLVLADIVLVGSAPKGRALRRSGGKAGDWLYVTGELGGAAAELALLAQTKGDGAAGVRPTHRKNAAMNGAHGIGGGPDAGEGHPQLYPEPRVEVGEALLRRRLARACIDLSDGLSTDLRHLCEASRVGAEIEAAALPVHVLARSSTAGKADDGGLGPALGLALHGGEDYELLFAASARVAMPKRIAGVRVTRIGRLVRETGIRLVKADGRRVALRAQGWEHFRGGH